MNEKEQLLTAHRLRSLLTFDEKTGVFYWRKNRGKVKVGDPAGTLCLGYIAIRIDTIRYQAHRLARLYFYGTWPEQQIDHRDGDRSNNRINNLRDVSGLINIQNERRSRRNNLSSGLLGVSLHKKSGRFIAFIRIDGVKRNLGYFEKAEDASRAYIKAKRKFHAGCTL
jgi:hypothetical protein